MEGEKSNQESMRDHSKRDKDVPNTSMILPTHQVDVDRFLVDNVRIFDDSWRDQGV